MANATEKWSSLDVGGFYEGRYEISSNGRFKILSKTIKSSLGKTGTRVTTETIGTGFIHRHGYRGVIFKRDGIIKHHDIHRLVALAFVPNPDNKPYVNHKNGIKYDNRAENLEWVTPSENNYHASKIGINNSAKGERNAKSKVTEDMVREMRRLYKQGKQTMRGLAGRYPISHCTIYQIVTYKSWKHIK